MFEEALHWRAVADGGEALLSAAAGWLGAMDHDYYALFGLTDAALDAVLQALLLQPDSEFGTAQIALQGNRAVGLVAAFPAAAMFARRMHVLKALLAAAPDAHAARARLRGFEGAGRVVPQDGHYLAKLAVAPGLHGRGIGGRLLAHFVDAARAAQRTPCLHVRRDNAPALALYRRHGFTLDPDPASATSHYWLLRAPGKAPT